MGRFGKNKNTCFEGPFNMEAAFKVVDYHVFRPIPQSFLDGIQANSKALTATEKTAVQNPGY
jgi:hypothetical protein